MTQQHPITPPPELVQEWLTEFFGDGESIAPGELSIDIAKRAAQWGADQELEACLTEVSFLDSRSLADKVRAARRPKPPSLKEQALVALHAIAVGANDMREQNQDLDTIRRALEQLDG